METQEYDGKLLNIHYESPMKKDAPDFIDLIECLELPFQKIIVSITPAQLEGKAADVNFSERDKKILKWAYETGKVDIAQQGYNHRCPIPKCNKMHELGVSYNKDLEKIMNERIDRGNNILMEFFGQSPKILAPPNHIFRFTDTITDFLVKKRF